MYIYTVCVGPVHSEEVRPAQQWEEEGAPQSVPDPPAPSDQQRPQESHHRRPAHAGSQRDLLRGVYFTHYYILIYTTIYTVPYIKPILSVHMHILYYSLYKLLHTLQQTLLYTMLYTLLYNINTIYIYPICLYICVC